jgi:predicted nucleic-acid-binding Zn-ribbon protein
VTVQQCRNCGSTERFSKEVRAAGYLSALFPIKQYFFPPADKRAAYELQVCGSCGLTDWFLPTRLLDQMKEKFDRMA